MSCEKNSLLCSGAAALTGISPLASKFGNTMSALIRQADRVSDQATRATAQAIAPISNKLLDSVDRSSTKIAAVAPYLVGLSLMGEADLDMRLYTFIHRDGTLPSIGIAVAPKKVSRPDHRQMGAKLIKVAIGLKAAKSISAPLLGNLASLTEQAEAQRTLLSRSRAVSLKGGKYVVRFAKSYLTDLINHQDIVVSSSRIISSEGDLVQGRRIGGLSSIPVTWHRGTTVIRMPGEKGDKTPELRTLTHLRSLTLPSQSLYFDRPLSDEEVAEMVTGQGKKPYQREGYVGSVSETESVLWSWAKLKRAMILTRLHWPPARVQWSRDDIQELNLHQIVSRRQARRAAIIKNVAAGVVKNRIQNEVTRSFAKRAKDFLDEARLKYAAEASPASSEG